LSLSGIYHLSEYAQEAIDICRNGFYGILVAGAGQDIEQEAKLIAALRT
jgi:hypothetical protein